MAVLNSHTARQGYTNRVPGRRVSGAYCLSVLTFDLDSCHPSDAWDCEFLVDFWKDLCIPDISEIQSFDGFHSAEHCDTVQSGRDCNTVNAGVQHTSAEIQGEHKVFP